MGQADRWEKDTQIYNVTGNWLDLTNEDDTTPTPNPHCALSTCVDGGMVLGWGRSGRKSFGDKHSAGHAKPRCLWDTQLSLNTPPCTEWPEPWCPQCMEPKKERPSREQRGIWGVTANHPPDNLPVA